MLVRSVSRPDQVRNRWRAGAAVDGWPYDERWWTAGVEALVDALTGSGGDPAASAERLGRERAAAGIRLDDALSDLDIGLEILRCSRRTRIEVSAALARGWADSIADWLSRSRYGCVDTLTELATRDYLTTRLRELYTEQDALGHNPADTQVLIAVSVRPSGEPIITERRMVGVGQALRSVFSRGETLARIAPSVAVALAHRDDGLTDRVLALQLELSWTGLCARPVQARTWVEPLPGEHELLAELIRDMCG
jgi:hypothetical protein